MSKRDDIDAFIDDPKERVFKSAIQNDCQYYEVEDLDRTDADTFPNRGVSLGDGRVLPSRGRNVGMVDSQTLGQSGPNVMPVADNWLNEGAPAVIGGEEKTDNGEWISGKYPAGHYLLETPDPDKRSTLPNWRKPEESGIAPAANFKPTTPAVLKRALEDGQCVIEKRGPRVADENRKGRVSFANVFQAANHDGAKAAGRFLSETPAALTDQE